MAKMHWRAISHAELAELLSRSELLHSEVVATSTVYHLQMQQHEIIAFAQVTGEAFLVETRLPNQPRRRHTEADE